MANKLPIVPQQHARFARNSDIFKGEEWLWDKYVNSEPNHSWGDNHRTLVIARYFKDEIVEVLEDFSKDNPDKIKNIFGNKDPLDNSLALKRLESLGNADDVYVDLES